MPLLSILLALITLASLLLASAWVSQKLALPELAEDVNMLAAKTLLAGYVLLFATGIGYALKSALADIAAYFSVKQSAQRKMLFVQNQRCDLEQLYRHRQRQLLYSNSLQRAHLLRANDARHIRLLAASIAIQLYKSRENMPPSLYKDFKNAIRRHVRHQDGEALLALQKQLDGNE
ncbi:MAG: hypothetical protein ACU837_07685 [Gammaproteobacteria bacterium]